MELRPKSGGIATISRDEWLAALGETVKPFHQDALTITEMSAMFGCGRQGAYYRVQKLVMAGKATPVFKHVRDAAGRMRPVPAYVLTTAKESTAHRSRGQRPEKSSVAKRR